MTTIALKASGLPPKVRLTETVVKWPNGDRLQARAGREWQANARVVVLLALFTQYKLWQVRKKDDPSISEFEIRGIRGELAAQLRDCLDNSHQSRRITTFQIRMFGTTPDDLGRCRLEQLLDVQQERGAFVARIKAEELSAQSVEIKWNDKRLESAQEFNSLLDAIGFPLKVDELFASVEIRIWDQHFIRQNMSTDNSESLPLHYGDHVKIIVQLSRPAHLYVVWMTSSGCVQPLYPWVPENWDNRQPSKLVDHLILPESTSTQTYDKWEIEGPSGVETLILLANNEKPLSDTLLDKLPSMLKELPVREAVPDRNRPYLFECRKKQNVHQERLVFDPDPITDPLAEFHWVLQDCLGSRCSLVHVESYAKQGEDKADE